MKRHILGIVLALATVAVAADLALVEPPELVKLLSSVQVKPVVLMVGPNVLYRSKHIPGSLFAGPGATPQGIALLRAAVAKLPKTAYIVVYCGCCPWDHCPNIKPAMAELRAMGYTRARALNLPQNFKSDWIDKGYPIGQ